MGSDFFLVSAFSPLFGPCLKDRMILVDTFVEIVSRTYGKYFFQQKIFVEVIFLRKFLLSPSFHQGRKTIQYENLPDIYHRKNTIDDFAIKFLAI
jgi:hypothetical protein